MSQQGVNHRAIPPWYFHLHRHICAIPQYATCCAALARYPAPPPPPKEKKRTKGLRHTIATSITPYGEYRCWASKRVRQYHPGLILFRAERPGTFSQLPTQAPSGIFTGFFRRNESRDPCRAQDPRNRSNEGKKGVNTKNIGQVHRDRYSVLQEEHRRAAK